MENKPAHPQTRTICIKYLIAAIIWMTLIFIVSGIPSDQIPKAGVWDVLVKKGAHMAAYALLAILWFHALGQNRSSLPAALAIAILYAVSDEYHQTFVAGRNGTFTDVIVDSIGVLVGLFFWLNRLKKRSRTNRNTNN